MKTKRILVLSLVLILLIPFTVWAQEQTQTTQKNPIEKIIELIVENNPTLQSQRDLIKEIEEMPAPGSGFIDIEALESVTETETGGIQTPLLSMTQLEDIRDAMLARKEMLEKARQTYESLKKSLLTELLTNLAELSKLENKKKSLSQLESFLGSRAESLTQQVKAGLQQPATLYDLTERIMNTSMEIENTIEETKTLKLQTAITIGGNKWKELLVMLDEYKIIL
ncbi:MAG: hypothetical protein GH144_00395 [Clostridia bacterium]|nr:hypothetical protein [Clostridia bacterium]